MGEADLIQDRVKRSYFLIRSEVDRTKAWEEAERHKTHAFGRLKFFHRPDPDEITCTEFKMYYEPYILIHGSKEIRERSRLNSKDGPLLDVSSGVDDFHEMDVVLILNKAGKEVDDPSPFNSLTGLSRTFYEEHREEFLKSDVSVRKAIETFRGLHNKGKNEASIIVNSHIHHIRIVYVPIFYAKYCWKKTGEHRIIKVDGRNCKSEVYTL
ncbi:MAG TPA: hypothetical protein VJ574_05085 [Candidatus Bathyarchaeia archaeon]|nr:MAG: hypothetical protein A3K70_02435 [Candidatus Bathyarchaeota archaeon RBG_16_48_13]HJX23765.1 hypothetical protein [Candidatus Bathyarchaeia archaeon]